MHKKINEFFCTVAGFRTDAIKRAPDALNLPATFGALLLLVSMISGITFGYALFRVFYGDWYNWLVAILGGLIWMPVIFCIDRLMLNSPNTGSPWAKVAKIGGRVALAVIVGFTISTPVFLRFQRNNIDLAIELANRDEIAKQAGENANLAGLPGSTDDFKQAAKEAREAEAVRAAGPSAFPEYESAVRSRDTADDAERDIENHNLTLIANDRAHLAALPPTSPEAAALRVTIRQLGVQINQAKGRVARADEKVNQAEQSWHDTTSQRLDAARKDEHESRQIMTSAQATTDAEDTVSKRQIKELSTPNLASELASADRIMSDPKNPKAASMRNSAFGIHCLFIILELTIITLKLTTGARGLDHTTGACEDEERERQTNLTNSRIVRMQAATDAATGLYLEALQKLAGTRQAQVTAHAHLSVADLHALKIECEELIKASF